MARTMRACEIGRLEGWMLNAGGDGGAGVRATAQAEMAAFDALPRELRAALADASLGWSAVDVLGRWRRAAARYGEGRATRAGVRAVEAARTGARTG